MADKWLTFDCYGTVADWNSGMGGALAGLAGVSGADAGRLLTAYHQAELEIEADPRWRPYREVLTAGLARAAERERVRLPRGGEEAFVRAWPDIPVFDDAGPALATLRERGWRLAFLTNCDEDLFATTRSRLPVPFDEWVTAEEVRSYKPDLAHFRRFAEKTGVTRADWIHVANSWVLDILPAARMGLRCVWVDRDLTGHPAKLADRRITSMRRLPEAVRDVNAIPPRASELGPVKLRTERAGEGRAVGGARRGGGDPAVGLGQAGHPGRGRRGGRARARGRLRGPGGWRGGRLGRGGVCGARPVKSEPRIRSTVPGVRLDTCSEVALVSCFMSVFTAGMSAAEEYSMTDLV